MNPRPRALVADDDVGIRVLVCRVLTRSGFDVDAAKDGAEAIEHILKNRYAAIVLDLMMPRVDGFQVVEYLNRHEPQLLQRVVVMTAFGATGIDRVAPLVSGCVEKPFEVTSLAQKVKSLIVGDPTSAQTEE